MSEFPKITKVIKKYEEKLRIYGFGDHDRIYPMSVLARDRFKEGIRVSEHLSQHKAHPEDYAFYLNELCFCYRHGLIGIGLPLDEPPSMPHPSPKVDTFHPSPKADKI